MKTAVVVRDVAVVPVRHVADVEAEGRLLEVFGMEVSEGVACVGGNSEGIDDDGRFWTLSGGG